MKRVVTSSLVIVVIFVAVAATLFLYYNLTDHRAGDPLEAMPADAAFFHRFMLAEKDGLDSLPWWTAMNQHPRAAAYAEFMSRIDTVCRDHPKLEHLFTGQPLYVAACATKADDFDLLYLVGLPFDVESDEVSQIIATLTGDETPGTTRRSYEGEEIYEYDLEGPGTFTYAISKDVFLGSFTAFLVEDAIRQQKLSEGPLGRIGWLKMPFDGPGTDSSHISVVRFRQLASWLGVFGKPGGRAAARRMARFADQAAFNVSLDPEGILLDGTVSPGDSSTDSHFLSGQPPVRMTLPSMLPRETAVAALYACDPAEWGQHTERVDGFDRAELLAVWYDRYEVDVLARMASLSGGEFGLVITEPAGTDYEKNAFFFLKTMAGEEAEGVMRGICAAVDEKEGQTTLSERYGGHRIGLLRLDGFVPLVFGQRFAILQKAYYAIIGDVLIFANQPSALRTLIDEINAQQILLNSPEFRKTLVRLGETGNLFCYVQTHQCAYLLRDYLSSSWNTWYHSNRKQVSGWNSVTVLLSGGQKNPSLKVEFRHRTGQRGQRATLRWTAALDTLAAIPPVVVRDFTSGRERIMIQDRAHTLYMIDGNGDIAWKRMLKSKILGKIVTVDLYGNGYSQYLFNTRTHLWLVDRQGRPVSNYPIRLPAPATTGMLHVGRNRTGQVYIPCENGRLYAYEASGKPLREWRFTQFTGPVSQPFVHLNLDGKEWIVGSDDLGEVYILDLAGRPGITATSSVFRLEQTPFYALGKSGLTTANYTGALTYILSNGEVDVRPRESTERAAAYRLVSSLPEGPQHVFLVEGRLKCFDVRMNTVFDIRVAKNDEPSRLTVDVPGKEQPVLICHSSASDLTYAFDMSGISLNGFPVRGGLGGVFADFNDDGKVFLVSASRKGMVYAYSLSR